MCTPADDDTRIRSPCCPNSAGSRPCTSHATIHGAPLANSGGGSSFGTAASCICRVAGVIQLSWCRFMRWRNTQPGSRAAAAGAIHRVEPGAVAPPGRFTHGTDELCSGRRLASRRVCCARSISHGAVCIPPDDHTRIRSPCCPSPARGRPRTSRAASYGMPRAIAGGGISFGTAASCICRVVVG